MNDYKKYDITNSITYIFYITLTFIDTGLVYNKDIYTAGIFLHGCIVQVLGHVHTMLTWSLLWKRDLFFTESQTMSWQEFPLPVRVVLVGWGRPDMPSL